MELLSVSSACFVSTAAATTALNKAKDAASSATTSSGSLDVPAICGTGDAPSLSATSLNAASAGSASGYATARMVTFSVTYPGGNVMTTTMSMSDFQAALRSNDPGALGSEECDGQTWNAKDSIKTAMGLGTTARAEPSSRDAVAPARSSVPPAAASEAAVAVAVLRTKVQDGQASGQDEGRSKSDPADGSTFSATGAAFFEAKSFSGSSDGMTVSVSIFSASIAAPVAAVNADPSVTGVSVIA